MKVSYNWLKWYIPDAPTPEKLVDVFTYHICEVEGVETWEDDTIFNLGILPNRAHDLLSHLGVARELSAILNIPFNDPTSSYKTPEAKPTNLEIKIETPSCRRYMARIIKGVKVAPSPEWVVKHLESIGQKSINNIVDATNLTMFNSGQPCHAFDADKIKDYFIKIRQAKSGEKMTLLTGEEKEFLDSDMVISSEDSILAIAGVKGGKFAEVTENTKNIILEVANFDPVSVRKTARRLGILTDSAKRFENDLSPEVAKYAMHELSALIFEMMPDVAFEEIIDIYPAKQEQRKIEITAREVKEKLGADYSDEEIENVFNALRLNPEKNKNGWTVFPPAERLDLEGVHDLIEEVGRFYGYDRVLPVSVKLNKKSEISEDFKNILLAREYLLSSGFSEVITYTFTKKGKVEVVRGAVGKSALRTNLEKGIKEAYEMNKLNSDLLGFSEIKIFEIGTVFPEKDVEEFHVAVCDNGGVREWKLDEFIKEKGLTDEISFGERNLDLNKFKSWSKYPFIVRDVAAWLPNETPRKEFEDILNDAQLLARPPRLLDEYQKDYKTSYAYRLVFQSDEKTLTDDEVAPIMESLYKKLKEKGWEVR
jgi:phenylalanyl-tRNA synthetase beta chain